MSAGRSCKWPSSVIRWLLHNPSCATAAERASSADRKCHGVLWRHPTFCRPAVRVCVRAGSCSYDEQLN